MTKTLTTDPMWRQARSKAIEMHGAQLYGGRPYVGHLDEVATVLATHSPHGKLDSRVARDWDEHLAAAYLHDAIEDTKMSVSDLMAWGQLVTGAVRFCTDEPGKTRRVRKAATYERCRGDIQRWAQASLAFRPEHYHVLVGLRVKLSDRIANLRACLRDPAVTFPPEGGEQTLLTMYLDEDGDFKSAYGFCETWTRDSVGNFWVEYEQLIRRAREIVE